MAKKGNDKYHRSLNEQVYDRFSKMLAPGESRKADKKTGETADKIYSYATYHTYIRHAIYFAKWVNAKHPEVTTLKKARKYIAEWLDSRVAEGLSAYTIKTEQAALNKLYGITPDAKDYYQAPVRNRADIKRSRVKTASDLHFSITNNAELIAFGKGTGLRKNKELAQLRGGDLLTYEELLNIANEENTSATVKKAAEDALKFSNISYFVIVKNGKGGKLRYAPIIGSDTDKIVERIKKTPAGEKVWQHIPSRMDEHSYRAEYARDIYRMYAREISDIPYDRVNKGSGKLFQSEVYNCRGDEKGKKLDKKAMYMASIACGHNRVSVVGEHYLYGL